MYTRRGTELTILHRATAAWLWSHREGVIAGLTASALHGAKYVGSTLPIEMIWSNRRPPPGIDIHSARNLGTDEIARHYGLALTSVERTAFDIGRRDELDDAVARLDALGNATRLHVDGVRAMARERHRGARGVRQLLTALDLHDPGAESPRETWLRLLLVRAGHPPPETQIQVLSPDRSRRYYLDMGWRTSHRPSNTTATTTGQIPCSSHTTSSAQKTSTRCVGRGSGSRNVMRRPKFCRGWPGRGRVCAQIAEPRETTI